MGNLGVDPDHIANRTAKAPADSSNESLRIVVCRVGDEERPTTVSLASVLPSLLDTGTQHVWGHVRVHVAAVAVGKHGDVNLVKSVRRFATFGEGSPPGYGGLPVGEGGSLQ